MNTLSKNGISLAMLLVGGLYLFNVDIDIDTANEVIAAIVTVISFSQMVLNQIMRSDTKFLLFKTK